MDSHPRSPFPKLRLSASVHSLWVDELGFASSPDHPNSLLEESTMDKSRIEYIVNSYKYNKKIKTLPNA